MIDNDGFVDYLNTILFKFLKQLRHFKNLRFKV